MPDSSSGQSSSGHLPVMAVPAWQVAKPVLAQRKLNLVVAAETPGDLAFVPILERLQQQYPEYFRFYCVLNQPPLGWTGGVGFINVDTLRKYCLYPPEDGDMVVICGPPVFEKIMCNTLGNMGFQRDQYYCFSQDPLTS